MLRRLDGLDVLDRVRSDPRQVYPQHRAALFTAALAVSAATPWGLLPFVRDRDWFIRNVCSAVVTPDGTLAVEGLPALSQRQWVDAVGSALGGDPSGQSDTLYIVVGSAIHDAIQTWARTFRVGEYADV